MKNQKKQNVRLAARRALHDEHKDDSAHEQHLPGSQNRHKTFSTKAFKAQVRPKS